MPAHQLIPAVPAPPSTATGRAVLDVLAGADHREAAECAGLTDRDLADAIEVFQHAGHATLAAQAASEWQQFYVRFADWPSAEQTATAHLLPLLRALRGSDNRAADWWFTRKHPCWRLRVRTGPAGLDRLRKGLDRLAAEGHLLRWWPGIYEAEIAAFGGPTSMAAAHDLFTADSHHLLQPAGKDLPLGRRELSVLLCTVLLRATGCEWYEQGDVWQRVITEEHRSHLHGADPDRLHALAEQLRTLLTADTAPDGPLLGLDGSLAPVAEWADAFRRAGSALAAALRDGTLDRGQRQILSLHVIFHWNRCGFSMGTQSALAWAARTAILDASG